MTKCDVDRFLLGVITLPGRLGFNKDRPIVSLHGNPKEPPADRDDTLRFERCSGVAQGGKLRHGQHCSPKCRLGHAPQPPSLTCDNGVIGSFECPEYIDPLQLACKEKCSAEGKGYKYQMKGGQPSCECLAAGDVFKLPF